MFRYLIQRQGLTPDQIAHLGLIQVRNLYLESLDEVSSDAMPRAGLRRELGE